MRGADVGDLDPLIGADGLGVEFAARTRGSSGRSMRFRRRPRTQARPITASRAGVGRVRETTGKRRQLLQLRREFHRLSGRLVRR